VQQAQYGTAKVLPVNVLTVISATASGCANTTACKDSTSFPGVKYLIGLQKSTAFHMEKGT
jgi:hypothetical protein